MDSSGLNVLQGEMSLVGTRPPTVKEVENYSTPIVS